MIAEVRTALGRSAGFCAAAWTARPLLTSLAVVLALCALSVALIDRPLAEYYRHDADRETVMAFRYLTRLGNATPYVVTLLMVLVACRAGSAFCLYAATVERLKRVTDACVFVLLSLAVSGAALHVLKIVIGRYRPRALFESGLYDVSSFSVGYLTSSFPSGHSQTVWALAAALIIVYPRYDLAYIALAALISFSRLVTTDHYLSDVLFGSFLGAAGAVLVKRRLYDRRGIPLRLVFDRDRALVIEAVPAGDEGAPRPRTSPPPTTAASA